MGDILTSVEYPAVRAFLGVGDDLVADATIELFTILDFVEAKIKEIISDWSTIKAAGSDDWIYLRTGTAAWVAARLCGYIEREESRDYRIDDYTQRPTEIDWSEKARELMVESARALAEISTKTTVSRIPLMKVDGPTRSGTNVPTYFYQWLDKIEPTVIDWLQDDDEEV